MDELSPLERVLLAMKEGLPPVPKHYELRCHPDVYLALRALGDEQTARDGWPPPVQQPVYGHAAVTVHPELGSGRWELYEDGKLLNSGQLRTEA